MVDKVFFILKPLKPKFLAAHGYALITVRRGGFQDIKGNSPEGLVISFEIFKDIGIKLKDIDFIRDATHNVYKIGAIVSTWEDYVTIECGLDDHKLIPYQINLDHNQKAQFVRELIKLSLKAPASEFYNTVKNSCVTKQLTALNSVLPKKKQISPNIFKTKILNVNAFVPKFIVNTYVRKGVLSLCKTKITKNNYFGSVNSLLK